MKQLRKGTSYKYSYDETISKVDYDNIFNMYHLAAQPHGFGVYRTPVTILQLQNNSNVSGETSLLVQGGPTYERNPLWIHILE